MELCFLSATELTKKLSNAEIGSRDLLEAHIDRIENYNPALNAVVDTDFVSARKQADHADLLMGRGESQGKLHGLPMTMKDTYETTGFRTTSGLPEYQHHQAETDADCVAALRGQGAVVMGRSNVPTSALDWQSHNIIYGRTNNPWDVERTPGGSSGGAAAGLAAGFTPLELGSDLGGSIRTPAHYSGVFGHKCSHNLLSMRGHIPGPPGMKGITDLAAAGPLARYADDLELLLDIMAGPRSIERHLWKPVLPKPRAEKLADYRVAVWLEDESCLIDEAMLSHYKQVAEQLKAAGVQVDFVAPPELTLAKVMDLYMNLVGSVTNWTATRTQQWGYRLFSALYPWLSRMQPMTPGTRELARSSYQQHRRWNFFNEYRERMRYQVDDFFQSYDVLLMPITPTQAIEHQLDKPITKRRLTVNGQSRAYTDHVCWISLASTLGLPATSAPVGLLNGLPINIQIVGACGQDRTTIDFARHLERLWGGFHRPPAM